MWPPRGLRTAVAYDAAGSTWIAVGPNGTDASMDDGRTWLPLTPGGAGETDKGWSAISLPFAVGPGGHIGRYRGAHTSVPARQRAVAAAEQHDGPSEGMHPVQGELIAAQPAPAPGVAAN